MARDLHIRGHICQLSVIKTWKTWKAFAFDVSGRINLYLTQIAPTAAINPFFKGTTVLDLPRKYAAIIA